MIISFGRFAVPLEKPISWLILLLNGVRLISICGVINIDSIPREILICDSGSLYSNRMIQFVQKKKKTKIISGWI